MPIDFLGNTEEYHQALVAALAEHDSHLITVMTGSRGTETAFELLCTKCDDVVFSRPGSGPKSEAQPPPDEARSAD